MCSSEGLPVSSGYEHLLDDSQMLLHSDAEPGRKYPQNMVMIAAAAAMVMPKYVLCRCGKSALACWFKYTAMCRRLTGRTIKEIKSEEEKKIPNELCVQKSERMKRRKYARCKENIMCFCDSWFQRGSAQPSNSIENEEYAVECIHRINTHIFFSSSVLPYFVNFARCTHTLRIIHCPVW